MTTPLTTLRAALANYDHARSQRYESAQWEQAIAADMESADLLAEAARAVLDSPCEGLCRMTDVELTQADRNRVAKMLERYAPNGGSFRVAIKRL